MSRFKNGVLLHVTGKNITPFLTTGGLDWVRPSDISEGLTLSGLMIDAKTFPVETRHLDSRELRLWQEAERIYTELWLDGYGAPSCPLSDALTAQYGQGPLTAFKVWKTASELDDLWDCLDKEEVSERLNDFDIVWLSPKGKYCVREKSI